MTTVGMEIRIAVCRGNCNRCRQRLEQLSKIYLDLFLQGKYRLGRKIGSGSFGDIYIGMLTIERASWRALDFPNPLKTRRSALFYAVVFSFCCLFVPFSLCRHPSSNWRRGWNQVGE